MGGLVPVGTEAPRAHPGSRWLRISSRGREDTPEGTAQANRAGTAAKEVVLPDDERAGPLARVRQPSRCRRSEAHATEIATQQKPSTKSLSLSSHPQFEKAFLCPKGTTVLKPTRPTQRWSHPISTNHLCRKSWRVPDGFATAARQSGMSRARSWSTCCKIATWKWDSFTSLRRDPLRQWLAHSVTPSDNQLRILRSPN